MADGRRFGPTRHSRCLCWEGRFCHKHNYTGVDRHTTNPKSQKSSHGRKKDWYAYTDSCSSSDSRSSLDTAIDLTTHECPDKDASARLSIIAPSGRQSNMRQILQPFCERVEGLSNILTVVEEHNSIHPSLSSDHSAPPYTVVDGEMNSPALSVMLFLPECGKYSCEEIRQRFHKPPWRHHHTIQLERSTSFCVLGKQEFYFLSRELPLWSVCPMVHHNSCRIRFNIFVRRYNAMVEFYRLITGTEMESSKPDFCLFPVNLELSASKHSTKDTPVTSYEVALKYCPHVDPYPLTQAYLTFPIKDMAALRTVLRADVTSVGRHHYIVHDPDGNAIILHDVTTSRSRDIAVNNTPYLNASNHGYTEPLDKDSIHSDSIDSGRFSDFDACSAELDHYMSELIKTCNLEEADDHNHACASSNHMTRDTLRPWEIPRHRHWPTEKVKVSQGHRRQPHQSKR